MNSLLLQIFIYLIASAIAVPLAKRLGLGAVLGYLVAGIVIGPFGMSLIGNVDEVLHFTEFGVVMMLFLVGLELKPSRLWEMRVPILGIGGVQVIFTALIAAFIAKFFVPWQQAIAIGATLSLSSTAIILQNLREKGLMNTSAGNSVFSVLLFQDIAVIPMLALFPLLATLSSHTDSHASAGLIDISQLPNYLQAIATISAIVAVIVIGRFIIRPIFRIIARTEVREIFIGTALAVVIGVSLLMNVVSLSPALGAFLAGVILSDSEYRHELESDIDPFKSLLLGIFFISIGASLNFILIGQNILVIAAITLGLIVIKWLILYITGLIFGMKNKQRGLFAIALAGGGEFAFVLFQFSAVNGILGTELTEILISAVAISMFLNPLLFSLYERFRMNGTSENKKQHEYDELKGTSGKVILAGFGRTGSDIGRILFSVGIKPVIIDNDIANIELVRRFAHEVYYGDITRLDLLESAGAANAELLIISISNIEVSSKLVKLVKRHYPHLKILTNSSGHIDANELMGLGVTKVERETFGTSLQMGQDALELLGIGKHKAYRLIRIFKRNEEKSLPELYKKYIEDESSGITMWQNHNAYLEELLGLELSVDEDVDEAWNTENVKD